MRVRVYPVRTGVRIPGMAQTTRRSGGVIA